MLGIVKHASLNWQALKRFRNEIPKKWYQIDKDY